MLAGFRVDLVDGGQGRARQLKLPRRLQTDAGHAALQGDEGLALIDSVPAVGLQAFKQGQDAVRLIRHGRVRILAENKLLVLSADQERPFRLAARGQIRSQPLFGQRPIVDRG